MKRFKKILYVHDRNIRSKTALKTAANLAAHNSAKLAIVEVLNHPPGELDRKLRTDYSMSLGDLLRKEGEENLSRLAASACPEGLNPSVSVLFGIPFIETIKEVVSGKHDLVIVSADEERGLGSIIFGTTTLHLIRKCPCPVWVVRPSRKRKLSTVLAAVGPALDTEVQQDLNRRIMELSSSLAGMNNARLHVVHAWSLYGEHLLGTRLGLGREEMRNLLEETQAGQQKQIAELVESVSPGLPGKNIHLIKGDAADVVPGRARALKADVIVMGTLSRTGIAGLLIGNTAEKILGEVDCSVLAVKPEGFHSPVGQ